MSDKPPKPKKNIHPRCDFCGRRKPDVRTDPTIGRELCDVCWFKTDPRVPGRSRS
jgi:recombinational DNA repair protein (RecF pathway)